ncbi:MAG: DNA polymerase III subunit gamma/tau [Candidatus Accumulibacter phosphatis]|uniref:DNA polymerase III subunit gamma/tau n=1 Tax=Candidatus Accumulibacter phosphatis TaxID=327160 RepID=UPI0006253A07|nr:DNA polymerase III subunit gamma/tau [Candidatus Accumulibacter phosphatis]MCC2868147.1 DNA polymerase III subunit gamma/tau [Candidatus Accumulibacter phosphatis]MCQ1550593.1 DNA polymerase III subunit gamma/tau [Candidatus Accumulibacter phosphatis]
MSYQVLARKWRPRTFASLVGQEHVVRALTHALTEQRLHHAYLFTGTRGVGKTTLARILAKALNCESGVTATPCGVCSACREIDSGRFVDLLEVDAATNTKVDEMRQLLENAVYAPTRGRFKVYVIDEVHMLSNSAFNAMLKTLEEPPEHVKFILATTDPQKIPVTVLSRCLQFNLKQMTPPLIAGHLKHILEAESISAEAAALQLLARSAAGSMRDALSLLDQAIAHGSGKIEGAQVREMLGAVDLDHLFSIADALLAGDAAAMLQVADDMATRSLSFDTALQEMAGLFTRLQIAQLAPQAIADDLPERSRLLEIAARLDPEFVQLAYQIAVHGRQELPLAPDEQAGFIMTLLRLYAFRPVPDDESGGRQQGAAPADGPVASSSTLAPGQTAAPAEAGAGVGWHDILAALKLGGMARELAQHCELRELGKARMVLGLSPTHRHLLMKPAQDKLQQSLAGHFGHPLQLAIELEEGSGDTPAAAAQRDHRERMDRAIASVEQDGFVRQIIETFDATLIESSIKPI